MLTLDLTNAPRWHDLAPGVRVQLRPLTTALMVATRSDPAVEAVPEVSDSLVVDLSAAGQDGRLVLFVTLRPGTTLDEALSGRIRTAIATGASPRHVPDEIHAVRAIPRTLSGKKMELPVKKLLLGAAPEAVLRRDAMANADAVDDFVALAATEPSVERRVPPVAG